MKLMAFVLACEVILGNYRFDRVNEVQIEKSWRELADKCEIRLPYKRKLDHLIAPGDAVSVKLWYQGLPVNEEFTGYVKRISPNFPFEVECEDHIYYFRKTPIKKTWKKVDKVTLKTVVKHMVDEVNRLHPEAVITLSSELPDVTFSEGLVIEAGSTAATALQTLKENFGLISYFKGRELFTGLAYERKFGDVKYSLAWNVIRNELTYRSESDILLKVKAIGIKKDNTKITVDDVGDQEGEQRTLYSYNVSSKEELKKWAQEELKKLKFTGYEGEIETFLYPYAEPLMVADIVDPNFGEARAGRYIIDRVKTMFSTYGARRNVELGIKLTV